MELFGELKKEKQSGQVLEIAAKGKSDSAGKRVSLEESRGGVASEEGIPGVGKMGILKEKKGGGGRESGGLSKKKPDVTEGERERSEGLGERKEEMSCHKDVRIRKNKGQSSTPGAQRRRKRGREGAHVPT